MMWGGWQRSPGEDTAVGLVLWVWAVVNVGAKLLIWGLRP